MMDIPLNVDVDCADGVCGRSTAVILNPVSQEVTHVVVTTQGLLPNEYEVPVTQIERSEPDCIQLRGSRNWLRTFTPFHKMKFIALRDLDEADRPPSEIPEAQLSSAWLWPYITIGGGYGTYVDVEQMPQDELAIHRGAHVEATDGRIGQVDEFIINPQNDHITHLVLREGHLWGQKDVVVPVSAIARTEPDEVYLKINKEAVAKLPAVPVKRWWR